ncbi:MAG: nucleotidyltransferase, partial [Bacteroides sp.]|nr:nucleotidyltransferase [Bacteroides sp.]
MNRHLISQDAPLIEAISKLNALSGSAMTLFAVDGRGAVTGSLTDGDVRRALLRGVATTDA